MADAFGALLRGYREAAGQSQLGLARSIGVSSGYISRLEAGERTTPGSDLVRAISDCLRLGAADRDRLLAAAGFLPEALAGLDPGDPALLALARVLGDQTIPPRERDEFRTIVRLIARRWAAEIS
jgi:transcriptional regulator with XRE-family HTH domain